MACLAEERLQKPRGTKQPARALHGRARRQSRDQSTKPTEQKARNQCLHVVCTQMGRPSGADCSATHATGIDGTRRIVHESACHMLHRTAASREGAAPVRVGASGAADARAGGGVAAVTVGVGAAARRVRRRRCRRRTILPVRSGPMTRAHGFVCSSWFSWCKPTSCLVKTDVLRG